MKFTGTLTVPGLGLSIPVEVDLQPEAVPATDDGNLTGEQLRARWGKCSARTLKRLRDQQRLPYLQPTPRTFLYRIEDVRAYEAQAGRGVHRRAAR